MSREGGSSTITGTDSSDAETDISDVETEVTDVETESAVSRTKDGVPIIDRIPIPKRDRAGHIMYLTLTDPHLVWKFWILKKYKYKDNVQYVLGWTPLDLNLILPTVISFGFTIFVYIRSNMLISEMYPTSTILQILYNIIGVLFFISYLRVMFTPPGFVDYTWNYAELVIEKLKKKPDLNVNLNIVIYPMTEQEHAYAKKRPIPERGSYSRRFRRTVLKADHICSLVFNYIGFKNYKFFVLALLYAEILIIIEVVLDTIYILGTDDIAVTAVVLIADVVYLVFLTNIFQRHFVFIINNITTLENLKRIDKGYTFKEYKEENVYDLGVYKNLQQVLGENILTWFLPIAYEMPGYGIQFPKKE